VPITRSGASPPRRPAAGNVLLECDGCFECERGARKRAHFDAERRDFSPDRLVRGRDPVEPPIGFFVHVNPESRVGEQRTKIVDGVEAKHGEAADPRTLERIEVARDVQVLDARAEALAASRLVTP
jgi:hypothetical protein